MKQTVENLHKIIASSIRSPHSYLRRARGFISELKFKHKCEKDKIKYLDGGWIFFKGSSLQISKEAYYVTPTFDDPERYVEFYKQLGKCPLIKGLFFFKIKNHNEWTTLEINASAGAKIELPKPDFEAYEFKNGKFTPCKVDDFTAIFPVKRNPLFYRTDTKDVNLLEYLNDFPDDQLTELYCMRYIIDFLMKGRDSSYAMDFDGIIIEKDKYFIAETKEKDPGPSNRNNVPKSEWFFGWDSIRLVWYLYLVKTTELGCYSVILEINNQRERKPIAWKRVEIMELCQSIFYGSAMTGGVGMGSTAGSTTIAPYEAFKEF